MKSVNVNLNTASSVSFAFYLKILKEQKIIIAGETSTGMLLNTEIS